jgi:thiamine biosynthesis lipoprotein ApbE
MMPFAHGRYSGLALQGPALFLLTMLLSTILAACRQQADEYLYQGTTLGTGYHITLYADLDRDQASALEAGIQGELATLEQHRDLILKAGNVAFGRFWLPPSAGVRHEVDRWFHAYAVDGMTQWLDDHRLPSSALLVEVGGVMRSRGTPPAGAWRLSLERAGLPGPDGARHIHLQDAALVHRFVQQEAAPLVTLATPLAVSVIAEDAREAMRQASRLINAGPEEAMRLAIAGDSAARVVVKTPEGIDIHHTAALESWLEP